jgi:hypothetical protein
VEARGPEDLLLKAIRSLPQDEQDEVLRSIIGQAFGAKGPLSAIHGADVFAPPEVTVVSGPPFDTVKQMTAPLLVRLPEDLHDRFRLWTTTNGFSMAAVARGLIERFLDDQERRNKVV